MYNLNADTEEGGRALFKGGPARVLRSSPQFGVVRLRPLSLSSHLIGDDTDASQSKSDVGRV